MAMAQPTVLDPAGPLVATLGEPGYNRRLTDKILAAFNHAYASGETAIAKELHALLAIVDEQGRQQFPQRRGRSALDNADLWMGFVEARNRYRVLVDDPAADSEVLAVVLGEMKDAYRRWSAA